MNPLFHAQWFYAAGETIQQPYKILILKADDILNSAERKELRYQRRKQKRAERKVNATPHNNCFEWVFSYEHLYDSYKKCRKGVAWKSSVQKYVTQAPLNVFQTHVKLMQDKFKSGGFYEFDIMERGKLRHIRSVGIGERVVQRCLCDYALNPVLQRTFIYDNGASLQGKGYSFSVRRLCQHLREHYRKHSTEGYILLFDFSKFFDRVSHDLIKGILRKEFTDERIIRLTESFIDVFGEEGLGLGSQVSQILALSSANRLDHYIKEVCRIRGYGRYMDDGYLIHHNKDYLLKCLNAIRSVCSDLGIVLNEKKTQIVKLSRGFTWLKIRFYLLDGGRVVKKLSRRSVTKMRQKLKSFRILVKDDIMITGDVYQSLQSWQAYARNFHSYLSVQSIVEQYNELFIQQPSLIL